MLWKEFKDACAAAGMQDSDAIWFVDCHPLAEAKALSLTRHATYGMAITDAPLPPGLHEPTPIPTPAPEQPTPTPQADVPAAETPVPAKEAPKPEPSATKTPAPSLASRPKPTEKPAAADMPAAKPAATAEAPKEEKTS